MIIARLCLWMELSGTYKSIKTNKRVLYCDVRAVLHSCNVFLPFPFLFAGLNMSQVSHPPKLTSSWSSALIPFCAYKTDLKMFKEGYTLPGIPFPLCSSFIPTILEGQLCYKLNLNMTSGQGKKNELMLLVDYNEDRSLQATFNRNEDDSSNMDTLNFDRAVESVQAVSAKVQINTLSPYVHFGGGIFMMTLVKKLTAKIDFLEMPLEERDCEVELYEDCRTRKLVNKCNCVPWELPGFQVGFTKCS